MKRLALLLSLAVCGAGEVAQAQTKLCLPIANGVPGTLAWQKPPNWWDAAAGEPLFNTALDAPAWRGAAAASFPTGGAGTDHVHFRGLHRNTSGTEYLYLSWWGKVVPVAASGQNELYFGFSGPAAAAGAQDVVIKITLTSFTDTGTRSVPVPSSTQYTASIFVKPVGSADTAWTTYSGSPAVPAWINGAGGTGRAWLFNEGGMLPAVWAFQLRIPITASNDLNNGIRVTSPFKHWFEFRAANLAGYTPYYWPRNAMQMAFSTPRPLSEWGETRLTSGTPESPDPECPANGVKLLSSNIGTQNADPHSINLSSPNTFFATPQNGMASNVSLSATFRIANWGTGATWESVPSPNTTLWTPVANGGPTTVLANSSNTITAPYTATQCDACRYQIFYAANTATCNASCSATTNNTKRNHQCLLVQLSGTGVDFINDSAYNNMNFANTSVFREDADVNLAGLPETNPGSLARDVYIFVQRSNMPKAAGGGGQPGGVGRPPSVAAPAGHSAADVPTPAVCLPAAITDPTVPREQRQAAISKGLAAGTFTYEDLQQQIATVVYHAYFDTQKPAPNGGVVLRPLNPFGYFPMHNGQVAAWDALLENAQQIAPNWYRIHVGPTGVAVVRPVISARDAGVGGTGRLRAFFDAGLNVPMGTLADVADGRASVNGGIEWLLPNDFSVEGVLGYHAFDADRHIWQVSGQVKRYFTLQNPRAHAFVAAGAGMYRFEPGDVSKAGVNLGGGLLYDVTARAGVEGVYYLHRINTEDSSTRFSTLQFGVRIRF